jgi:hypothetical protein
VLVGKREGEMILSTQLGTDRKAINYINCMYAGALRAEIFSVQK